MSQVRPRNSTSVRISSSLAPDGGRADDEAAGKRSLGFGHQAPQARAVFRRADAARDADVIDRGHVDEEAAGQRDVARDARAFFAKRFFCNLYNDFLAGLQHFGNELRAPVLFVPRVPVLRRGWCGTPAAAAASALRAASAAHGPLEAGARLFGNARARRRLSLAGCGASAASWNSSWRLHAGVFFRVFFSVLFSMSFRVFFHVLFSVFWRRLRGQRFVMHFVGDGVGFLRRVLVIVFARDRRSSSASCNSSSSAGSTNDSATASTASARSSASACASSCLASASCSASELTSSSERPELFGACASVIAAGLGSGSSLSRSRAISLFASGEASAYFRRAGGCAAAAQIRRWSFVLFRNRCRRSRKQRIQAIPRTILRP